jgi:hypothetical protein
MRLYLFKCFFFMLYKISFIDNFYDRTIPKHDICQNKNIEHPVLGYIHSPNYPNKYDSNVYCQMTIKKSENIERYA